MLSIMCTLLTTYKGIWILSWILYLEWQIFFFACCNWSGEECMNGVLCCSIETKLKVNWLLDELHINEHVGILCILPTKSTQCSPVSLTLSRNRPECSRWWPDTCNGFVIYISTYTASIFFTYHGRTWFTNILYTKGSCKFEITQKITLHSDQLCCNVTGSISSKVL